MLWMFLWIVLLVYLNSHSSASSQNPINQVLTLHLSGFVICYTWMYVTIWKKKKMEVCCCFHFITTLLHKWTWNSFDILLSMEIGKSKCHNWIFRCKRQTYLCCHMQRFTNHFVHLNPASNLLSATPTSEHPVIN